MSVTVEYEAAGVVTVRISGRLSQPEWLKAQQEASELLENGQSASLLVIAQNFLGWERGDWDDMSFQLKHDHQIRRLAIVTDNKWKDEVLLFTGKGFRKFEIEHFEPADLDRARAWSQGRTERAL